MVCLLSLGNVRQEHLRLRTIISHEKAATEEYSIHCYQTIQTWFKRYSYAWPRCLNANCLWVEQASRVACQQNVRISLFLLDSCPSQRLADSGRRHILTAAVRSIICGRWSWPLIIHTSSHLFIVKYMWSPSSLRWLCGYCSYDCPFFFQVKKFAKYLDPNAHGRINFKDFCHGVFAIKGKRTVPLEQYFMPMPTLMNLFSWDQRVSSSNDEIKSYTAKIIFLFSLVFQ